MSRSGRQGLPCLLLAVTWLALCAPFGSSVAPSPQSPDFQAMVDLRTALELNNPGALSSWRSDSSDGLCAGKWRGSIECDPSTQRVIKLDLNHMSLSGPLPGAELANLPNLVFLSLDDNMFEGNISSALGDLLKLETLSLKNNKLTGNIPSSLGNIMALTHLMLSHNKLTGPVPDSLGGLPNLLTLELGDNMLTGGIPHSLGNLKKLDFLSLSANQLSGPIPKALGNLEKLSSLHLYSNHLNETLPEELGNLKSLTALTVDRNMLEGVLPATIGDLQLLTSFYAASNRFAGPIPDSFRKLTNLIYLDLSFNSNMSGGIPSYLGTLSSLNLLALESCGLDGSIPPELGKLSVLRELYLNGNKLTGGVPPELGQLSKLTELYLSGNRLNGSIPSSLCNLRAAFEIVLSSNQLTGHLDPCLTQLPSLITLNVAVNRLSGSVPPTRSPKLKTFNFDSNCLAAVPHQRQSCSDEVPATALPGASKAHTKTPFAAGMVTAIIFGCLVIAILSIGMYFLRRDTLLFDLPFCRPKPRLSKFGTREFSVGQIRRATRNFQTLIGTGSYGPVYLAEDLLGVGEGPGADRHFAVKRSQKVLKHSDFLFKCKVEVLSRAHHRCLSPLLGYCCSRTQQMLVHPYYPQGSLHDRLHIPNAAPLGWNARVRIAVEVASAMDYLHHTCSPAVMHRNLTSSNIFLTADDSAKVADFGLMRQDGGSMESNSTPSGYADPYSKGATALPEKIDIYAYGVILLELLTGQRAMKEISLAKLATPFLQSADMMSMLLDSRLEGQANEHEVAVLGGLARDCISAQRLQRPTMRQILKLLEEQLRLDPIFFDLLLSATMDATVDVDEDDESEGSRSGESMGDALLAPEARLARSESSTRQGGEVHINVGLPRYPGLHSEEGDEVLFDLPRGRPAKSHRKAGSLLEH